MSGTKISTVVITLNEERNIGRLIDSVQGVSEEIVVVDSFSTDRTKMICKEKGVRFLERNWEGYSATKNWANEQATFDYIFSMDADEELTTELQQSILAAKKTGLNGVYYFNRLTNYCGSWIKHCGWYPDQKVRIFPKSAAKWKGDFVHEELVISSHEKQTHLKGDNLHYSYYTTNDHEVRIQKYSELAAQAILAKNQKPGWHKQWLSGWFKWFKTYFIQLGFLDGKAGWNIAWFSGKAVYLKYKKARQQEWRNPKVIDG